MRRAVRNTQTGRAAPWQQANWDWRAAGNFIGGGSGGGLLIVAAAVSAWGAHPRVSEAAAEGAAGMIQGSLVPQFAAPLYAPLYAPLALAAMLLVVAGLVCVWLEIGRPWRALNVFRHPGSSWMTREALLAPALLLCAGAAAFSGARPLVWLAAALGGLFLYAQARILAADKGIPAWRQRRSVPLLVVTGLTEGAALFAALLPLLAAAPLTEHGAAPLGATLAASQPAAAAPAPLVQVLLPLALLGLIGLRAAVWRGYLAALQQEGAPRKALAALQGLDRPLLFGGHLVPALLIAGGAIAALPWLAAVGALGAVAGGWTLKYTLLRRAGYTQGYALPHLPVRGRQAIAPGSAAPPGTPAGHATDGVQPGWSKPPTRRD